MSNIPKAVLYYSQSSIWSSAALLTLEEKGYGDDELDLKFVDIAKGENFGPSFLRLNSKATVPTLVVPLQKTLSEDVESRYKAITETKAIVEFLDKSRSALSPTNTVSNLPAPALAPATVAFSSTCRIIVDELHSDDADPNNLLYMNARDDASLRRLADELLPLMKGKVEALARYLSEAQNSTIRVSEKVVKFWTAKKEATQVLLDVYENAAVPEAELDAQAKAQRTEYFKVAKLAWEVNIVVVLAKLNEATIGPYTLGEQYSIADPHLTAWLARVISLAGGKADDNGNAAFEKLEKHIGTSRSEGPRSNTKLSAYWDAVKERPSWKKVYANGLH
ncbi:hypothetical protein BT96DRAFT_849721 [Gymnopus androsaceus JB14]|uniref:GST N-terminal domain-containing protein n=1 Tax=Gymnopus androsaceus JB14 TaxID=1447944 RepID=A0A6A4IEH2_9AGAR|nr:hypothetical protein BT96DRAFT_849721 [Gymnopus androsaceus JB14]